MTRIIGLVAGILAASCGSGESARFMLQVGSEANTNNESTALILRGGETKTLGLLVVGTVPGPVTFSGRNLPAFAMLSGSVLTLAPTRADMGDYSLTLIAAAGGESQSSTLRVSVLRFNSPPTGGFGYFSDDTSHYETTCPNPVTCTAIGTPVLHLGFCDAEGDGVTTELEVIERGRPFTKTPTYSTFVPAGAASRYNDGKCGEVTFPLPGLTLQQSYDFAIRLSDEFGAVTMHANDFEVVTAPEGWMTSPRWGFDQGPCTTRNCACLPSGSEPCLSDFECCSGVCRPDVHGWPTCQPCTPEQHCSCMPSGHGPCLVDTDCCSGSCQLPPFSSGSLTCK